MRPSEAVRNLPGLRPPRRAGPGPADCAATPSSVDADAAAAAAAEADADADAAAAEAARRLAKRTKSTELTEELTRSIGNTKGEEKRW